MHEAALRARYGTMPGMKNVVFQADISGHNATAYVDTADLIRKRGVPGAPCR